MSVESSAGQRFCETCGNAVPQGAQYCPSCGARLVPADESSRQSFEDAIASVLGDDPEQTPLSTASEASTAPAFEPATSSTAPEGHQPSAGSWSTSTQIEPSGWAAYPSPAAPVGSGRNRTLWIILAVFGFIVFCCCGLVFVSVAVASEGGGSLEQVLRSMPYV